MRIWLVQIGESLPIDADARPLRAGILARRLVAEGHEVTWWADSFDHFRKAFRRPGNERLTLESGLTLQLLSGPPYSKNVSLARLRNHAEVARQFRALCRRDSRPPQVIYCGYPTLELSREAVAYARQRSLPILLDVRDPWPELFLSYLKSPLRGLARLALLPYARMGRSSLRAATALTAMSESLLRWALAFSGRPRGPDDEVFYLAYENPEGQPQEAVELGGVRPALRCLFIGTLGAVYDIPAVIGAARRVESRQPGRTQFVIAGDGPRSQEFRALARGLPNVVFLGWVTAGQLRHLLGVSDLGLIAIARIALEAVPNKSFEYMSGGLALVNSTRGDLGDLVPSLGIGVNYEAENPADLAAEIEGLLDRPSEVAAMKLRSRQLYLERFEAGRVYGRMAAKIVGLGQRRVPTA